MDFVQKNVVISIKVERSSGNTGPVFKVDRDKFKLKEILKVILVIQLALISITERASKGYR